MPGGERVVLNLDRSKRAETQASGVVLGTARNRMLISFRTLVISLLLGAFLSCAKPPAETPVSEPAQPTGLESIPPPDPAKYPKISEMGSWQNPYLVVREDGIGFVDLSNHEIHILKAEEIPAELVSLSSSAWPYGRVVLVSQAAPKDATEQTKIRLRENRALLLGTLKELDVQFREAP
jgi:hypothetical protein